MAQLDATRLQILEAAMERILHYGYAKTTMSEIARDCQMSAGNIYRFFASKLDIAEAMAREFHEDAFATFEMIAAREAPAADRLREHFHYDLARTYTAIEAKAKILEVAEVLAKERPLFMNAQLARERVVLVSVLEGGVSRGEFRPIADAEETAEMMQSALMKFRFPQLFSMLTLPRLQRELDGVLDLLIAGVSRGASVPAPWEGVTTGTLSVCPLTGRLIYQAKLKVDQ